MSEPLATILRPKNLEEVVGQEHITKLIASFLEQGFLPSMIFYGPPGTGKTTVARISAEMFTAKIYHFSAVRDSTADIKKRIYADHESLFAQRQMVFVDELHRFNKAQQDIFLPMIEEGVVFIGATTENPSFYVNNALLSRTRAMRFEPIGAPDIVTVLKRGLVHLKAKADDRTLAAIAEEAQGDLRIALSVLESAFYLSSHREISWETARKVLLNPDKYDKKGDYHYRLISAFIKSLRGSDPDAALYYLVRMLDAGDDPLFLIRRMIIFASEDVGNADPRALEVAVAALHGFRHVGLPEGELILAQCVTYLATAPKSNASYLAIKKAKAFVREHPDLRPPQYLVNATSLAPEEEGGDYRYPHDFPGHWVDVRYFPEGVDPQRFYEPTDIGYEGKLKAYWEKLKKAVRNGGKVPPE